MGDQHLEREHENAHEMALQMFQSKRIRDSNFSEDCYKSQLEKVSQHSNTTFVII